MNEKYVLSLFPTPVMVTKYNCGETIRHALLNEEMREDTVPGYGIFSKDTYILEQEKYVPLAQFIMMNAYEMMTDVLSLDVDDLKITQSWISHKSPAASHESHTHGNSYLSGVYYFDYDSTEIEPITFQKSFVNGYFNSLTAPLNNEGSADKPFSWDYFKFNPSPDTLVIFPSWLPHKVDANRFNRTRKCLAFNIMPRILGDAIKLNELKLW